MVISRVRFSSRLLEGRLLRRYKRFFADVELQGGERVTAHCANPGSMRTCLEIGGQVWLSESTNPKRKLRLTWEIARVGGTNVFVNPLAANRLVAEAIRNRTLRELAHYPTLAREVRSNLHSRLDFLLSGPRERCYVEVKNVTLTLGAGRAAFPDSVTERGTRHLKELIRLTRAGHRTVLLFCVSRSDARSVEPAVDIDPTYAHWLGRAADSGVELLAYKCAITQRGIWLSRRLPVILRRRGDDTALQKRALTPARTRLATNYR